MDEPGLAGEDHCLDAVTEAELLEDVPEHLELTFGELVPPLRTDRESPVAGAFSVAGL
jgi:hypothetical protein